MKKNRALFHVVAIPLVLALAGCATFQSSGEADKARGAIRLKYPNLKVCQDASCDVTVTATACDGHAITPVPVEVAVVEKPMVLVWTIRNSPDFAFDRTDGVYIKGDPEGQFKCKPAHGSDVVFQCTNKNHNTVPTPYSYGLKLVYKNSQRCQLDPIIINGY
jgi:hypothetical protein